VLVRASGRAKHGEIMTMLKSDHGMSHGFANLVALTALRPDESAPADDLVDAMYAGPKASLRPLRAQQDSEAEDDDAGARQDHAGANEDSANDRGGDGCNAPRGPWLAWV
jgi:hypothetical protein